MHTLALILLVALGIVACSSPEPSPTPLATPHWTPPPPPREGFSEEALVLRAAFEELIEFKDEAWFHVFCYAQSSPASQWADYLQTHDFGIGVLSETGIVAGELWQLGWDYCQNEGKDTDYTRRLLGRLEPEWVNMRPVPTPVPELHVNIGRPFADLSYDLASCIWDNPTIHPPFAEEMSTANDVGEFAVILEGALDQGTLTTWHGAINILTACQHS